MTISPQAVNNSTTVRRSAPRQKAPGRRQHPTLLWLNRDRPTRAEAGGKGASLGQLMALGAPVPSAFAIPVGAYAAFASDLDLPQHASGVAPDALGHLRERIASATLPGHLTAALAEGWAALAASVGQQLSVAVRSSGTGEDSTSDSFAGLHDTVLDVRTLPDLEVAVKRCWASVWSGRAHAYRVERGLADERVEIAVVVQQLVQTDVSFVAFTSDPVGQHKEDVVITATWGLGEAVVAGLTVPDHVSVAPDGSVRSYIIGQKHIMVIPEPPPTGGVTEVPVPRAMQRMPVLAHEDAARIAATARALSASLGYQADLEGGIADGELYLFQARPITTHG